MRDIKDQEFSERRHFDKLAKMYDENYGYGGKFFEYKKVKKLQPLIRYSREMGKKRLSILEIGCGTGEYTQNLAQIFPKSEIVGIDISPEILKIAKQKCKKYKNIRFRVASAYQLPFKKAHFDLICGFYIAHHLNLQQMFKSVSQFTKKGGMAYFVEPNILNPAVYLIKNVPWLKHKAGDSPDETAINPFTINKYLPPELRLHQVVYSEYLPPFSMITADKLILFDKFTNTASRIPVVKLIGGSVMFSIKKYK